LISYDWPFWQATESYFPNSSRDIGSLVSVYGKIFTLRFATLREGFLKGFQGGKLRPYVHDIESLEDMSQFFVPISEFPNRIRASNKIFYLYMIRHKVIPGFVISDANLLQTVAKAGTTDKEISIRHAQQFDTYPPEKYVQVLLKVCSPEAAKNEGWINSGIMVYSYETLFYQIAPLCHSMNNLGYPDQDGNDVFMHFAEKLIAENRVGMQEFRVSIVTAL